VAETASITITAAIVAIGPQATLPRLAGAFLNNMRFP
jgi:hypothetical protein